MISERPVLPPEIDVDYYRATYQDLAPFDDDIIIGHFLQFGEAEGRAASPATLREGFIDGIIAEEKGAVLEIGPFCSPLISGPNVSYLDMFNAEELRAKAIGHGFDASGCPEKIDFVGDIALIDKTFAAVVSSHSLEHQPDLVHHLENVARILDKGGRYYAIIPDHRYCFDALLPESMLGNVLQAHRERRTRHTLQSLIEHRTATVHNDAARHWLGDHGTISAVPMDQQIKAAIEEYERAGTGYLDVHAWYLNPHNFRTIVDTLFQIGLISLKIERVYSTPLNRFEFCAVLEKQ
jgi:SAM-dependent methyltransferase